MTEKTKKELSHQRPKKNVGLVSSEKGGSLNELTDETFNDSPQPLSSTDVLEGKKASKSVVVSSSSLTDPLLSAYMKEVQRYPLLSREEEKELALDYYHHKTKESLQRLVTSNLRFVVKIAFEYVHYRMKLLDLIQEGNMGLVKAVQEFDPYKEVRLTTYAVWWIRSFIQEAILKNYSLVKMGTTSAQKKLFYRLRKEQKALESQGISPKESVKLLAHRLDVKEKEVEEMDQRMAGNDLSLNAPMSKDEKKEHIDNLTSDSVSVDIALGEIEQAKLFHDILKAFGTTLEGREKFIFEDRLISENPLTLLEIGDKYGFTKERARQIEEQVKEKLRSYVEKHYPDFNILVGKA